MKKNLGIFNYILNIIMYIYLYKCIFGVLNVFKIM